MASHVDHLMQWLDSFPPGWAVWVEDGCIVASGYEGGAEYTMPLGGRPAPLHCGVGPAVLRPYRKRECGAPTRKCAKGSTTGGPEHG